MLFDFREKKGGGEKQRYEIGCLSHAPPPGTKPVTQARAPSGNRTHNLSVHRQHPESHQHGQKLPLKCCDGEETQPALWAGVRPVRPGLGGGNPA